jgi:hypothetical protein
MNSRRYAKKQATEVIGGTNMPRLRSSIDPEEQPEFLESPTSYRIGTNQSQLLCSFCNGIYYVDNNTFQQVMSAMEEGIDNPFCCDDCEAELEELSH